MMAEASAKLTGQPGVCFVTRGPGATNAASGIHVSAQDSTPVVLLIGQVSRDTLCREAFQEIDYSLFYGPIAKHVEQVHDATRLPEVMSRAFHTACNGRPGPVVVVLPEDMLEECAKVEDLPARQALKLSPNAADMARFTELLSQAKRPILLAGGATGMRPHVLHCTNLPRAGNCRWRLRGATRMFLIIPIPTTSVTSESVSIRRCRMR